MGDHYHRPYHVIIVVVDCFWRDGFDRCSGGRISLVVVGSLEYIWCPKDSQK